MRVGRTEFIRDRDFFLEVSRGNIPDWQVYEQYAKNENTISGTEVSLAAGGVINFLTAPDTVLVASGGNVNDTASGTGARKILVQGIDENLKLASETIELAGASASASTTTKFWRLFRAIVTESGTYTLTGAGTTGSNQGEIVVESTTDGTQLITIQQYESNSQYGCFSIPKGYVGHLSSLILSVASNKSSVIRTYLRQNFTNTSTNIGARSLSLEFDGVSGVNYLTAKSSLVIPELSDIWFTAVAAANNTLVSINFEMLLEPINGQL